MSQNSKNKWWKKQFKIKPVSSFAGDVFCLVTAGTAIGQSDQYARFEWGGPSCLLLTLGFFYCVSSEVRHAAHTHTHTFIETPSYYTHMQCTTPVDTHIYYLHIFASVGKFQTAAFALSFESTGSSLNWVCVCVCVQRVCGCVLHLCSWHHSTQNQRCLTTGHQLLV